MKIFVSSKSFLKDKEAMKLLYDKFGYNSVMYKPTENISEANGLIAGTEIIDADIINNATNLKVISRFGVGIDNIDTELCELKGIKVYITRYSPSRAVAELTFGLMLSVSRRIVEADRTIRDDQWNQLVGHSLYGKKLGIVGLGRIGKEVARLVKPFGMQIVAYDILIPKTSALQEFFEGVKMISLNELLKTSDIVSLHLPLNDTTRHMINRETLALMKPSSILINTSRGGLVDDEALILALMNRQIGGAGIDVFEEEPYDGRLKYYNNTVLTCHMGSASVEARKEMVRETVENLEAGLMQLHTECA